MRIVCATNMPYVSEAFGTLGDAVVLEGRAISAGDVREAELLAVRSTTRVDRALLEGSRVRFVGTATIGTDHMDTPYLESAGIRWCYAPGCNANSVSEYVTAALLCVGGRHGIRLEGRTLGVVGVGNVGSAVARKAAALGMRVLLNDPPRARREGAWVDGAERREFVPLDQVLAESDVVTLHVPLTKDGPDATRHMADASFFACLKRGCLFVNAARGAVVEADALLAALRRGTVAGVVLDTWEGEPQYRQDVLDRAEIGTPHIAGHSFEGKYVGTLMIYREACRFLGVPAPWTPDALLPPPLVPRVTVDAAGRPAEAVLRDIVRQVYDIEADDRRLREGPSAQDPRARAAHFDGLRQSYPMRREFRFTRVSLPGGSPRLAETVSGLGFVLDA